MEEYYLIAEITSAFEEKGYFYIKSYSDFSERFNYLKEVYIEVFGDKKKFVVEKTGTYKNRILIKLKNFNSAEDIAFLIGCRIFVDSSGLVKPDESTYFVHDLIGCRVFRNSDELGVLSDVLLLPANDVYVVALSNGEELLIPAVHDFIDCIDIKERKILLKPGNADYYVDED